MTLRDGGCFPPFAPARHLFLSHSSILSFYLSRIFFFFFLLFLFSLRAYLFSLVVIIMLFPSLLWSTFAILCHFYFKKFLSILFRVSFNLFFTSSSSSFSILFYSITLFSIVNISFCYSSILAIMYSLNDNYYFFFFLISLISIIYFRSSLFRTRDSIGHASPYIGANARRSSKWN